MISSITLNAQTGKRTNTMTVTITNGITKCAEGNRCKENFQQSPGFLNISSGRWEMQLLWETPWRT